MLEYVFPDTPEPGELREVASGVWWLRMPLPLALNHINLYLLKESDGWRIVDTGIALGPTGELWEQIFDRHLGGKPVKAVLVVTKTGEIQPLSINLVTRKVGGRFTAQLIDSTGADVFDRTAEGATALEAWHAVFADCGERRVGVPEPG